MASGLRAAGLWPANLPLLLDAAQLGHYDRLLGAVRDRHGDRAEITRRLREHRDTITTPEARRDLTGGTLRLRVIAGETAELDTELRLTGASGIYELSLYLSIRRPADQQDQAEDRE